VPSGAPTPKPITAVTGTLTYREPYQLTGDAFAVVALVRGSARATENSVVASTIDRDITSVPVDFELELAGVTIDPNATYTVQATIVDGENAWVTGKGVPVLTKGNPSNVDITLTYRPDLVKGAVSGQITGVGVTPSTNAYAMAVLMDPSTGESLGIDVRTVDDGLPSAFSIGYTITDIAPNDDYVVTAEVGDGGAIWRNAAGVPVITNGNPKSGIEVVVAQVVAAGASPSPSASPTPSASPVPTPPTNFGRTGDLLPWIVVIVLIAAVAAFFIARGWGGQDELPPDATPTTTGAAAAPVVDEAAPGAEAPPIDDATPTTAETPTTEATATGDDAATITEVPAPPAEATPAAGEAAPTDPDAAPPR
jgi:uncharacterized lipoprotein YbaY